MNIKEAVYEKCPECGRSRLVAPAKHGCDTCRKPIELGGLGVTAFYDSAGENDYYKYCSWDCLIKQLPDLKATYFIELPTLDFSGEEPPGCRFEDFLRAIGK